MDDQLMDHDDTNNSGSDHSSEDDLDTDILDDQDSLQEVEMEMNIGNNNESNIM